MNDPNDRLRTIGGIYCGATWSLDFQVESKRDSESAHARDWYYLAATTGDSFPHPRPGKACIEQLTTQKYEQVGAVGVNAENQPEIDFGRLAIQGPLIRFFEEAFEWARIVYFFYPYCWSRKSSWMQRLLFDDSDDPSFADLLPVGAARVVFPVRPRSKDAVIRCLETSPEWEGGDPPIRSSLYVPIVQKVAEAEPRLGDEVAMGDPWEVCGRPQLIKLRPDRTLPALQRVSAGWVPAN